jgi:hypothetical protein
MERNQRTSTYLRAWLLASLGALTFAFPTSAIGVTIGSDLKPAPTPNSGFGCGSFGTCMVMQRAIPGNPNPIKSPKNGLIRKWRYRKGVDDHTYEVRLRVVRKDADGKWKVLRQSSLEQIPEPAGTYRFDTRLRIRKGQFIAMRLEGEVHLISVDHSGARHLEWFPSPPLGSLLAPDYHNEDIEFLWNATVRKRR